jgi:hypothetical protein
VIGIGAAASSAWESDINNVHWNGAGVCLQETPQQQRSVQLLTTVAAGCAVPRGAGTRRLLRDARPACSSVQMSVDAPFTTLGC